MVLYLPCSWARSHHKVREVANKGHFLSLYSKSNSVLGGSITNQPVKDSRTLLALCGRAGNCTQKGTLWNRTQVFNEKHTNWISGLPPKPVLKVPTTFSLVSWKAQSSSSQNPLPPTILFQLLIWDPGSGLVYRTKEEELWCWALWYQGYEELSLWHLYYISTQIW